MKLGSLIAVAFLLCVARPSASQGTYKKMDYASFCSSFWVRITSEATCKAAAVALNLKWGSSWHGTGDFPGCLHTKDSRNLVYFNTSPNPSNNPKINVNYAEICQAQEGTSADIGSDMDGDSGRVDINLDWMDSMDSTGLDEFNDFIDDFVDDLRVDGFLATEGVQEGSRYFEEAEEPYTEAAPPAGPDTEFTSDRTTDGSIESDGASSECNAGDFFCKSDEFFKCIPMVRKCDGINDCWDSSAGSDEENCVEDIGTTESIPYHTISEAGRQLTIQLHQIYEHCINMRRSTTFGTTSAYGSKERSAWSAPPDIQLLEQLKQIYNNWNNKCRCDN